MIITDTTPQGLHKALIIDMIKVRLEIRRLDIKENIRLIVRRAMGENMVNG
jgi:hypothetical protein